ncbi:MAG: DUF4382 domain-containing protein [Gammaproteobacteria bacterium]|nr:DUF4382 domain-containing protein [Gammaproteobacteria bacterium]
MRKHSFTFLALALSLFIASCGGGGGSGGTTTSEAPATVGLLITDAPVGRWDEAIATITSVKLIGDNRQVTLFEGEESLDLLQLADFSELFAVSDQVPPGSYSKIRLQVSDLVLRDTDRDENDNVIVIEEQFPQIVGNGKIDLNPRGPFQLESGDVVFVELDFDMEKSLKITETGNGKLIVRPVIFVDIRTQPRPDARLTRIHGEITGIDLASSSFRLCQTGFASKWNHEEDDDDHEVRRCIGVSTDEATGLFDASGLPQDFTGLAEGEEVTAIGRLRPRDEADFDFDNGDDDHPLVLDAFVVEEGPLGTYQRVRGIVTSTVDAVSDRFSLDLAAGQGIVADAPLPVQLYPKSRIFSRDGEELTRDDILVDRGALIDGLLAIGSEDVIRSPLVILGIGELPAAVNFDGTILSVDTVAGSLMVSPTEGNERCIDADSSQIFLVDDDDGFSSVRGDLDDLEAGQSVSIFGTEDIGGCVIADTIIAEAD